MSAKRLTTHFALVLQNPDRTTILPAQLRRAFAAHDD